MNQIVKSDFGITLAVTKTLERIELEIVVNTNNGFDFCNIANHEALESSDLTFEYNNNDACLYLVDNHAGRAYQVEGYFGFSCIEDLEHYGKASFPISGAKMEEFQQ